jgi:hypothetical protein
MLFRRRWDMEKVRSLRQRSKIKINTNVVQVLVGID